MSSSRTLRSDSARSLRLSRSSSSRGSTRSLPVERPLPSLPEMRSRLQDEISKVPATDHMTLFVASQLAAVVEAFDKFEHQADAMNQLKETVVDEFSAFRVTFAKTNLVVFRMAFIRRMFERLTELLKALGEVVNNVNQETIVDRTTWEEKLGAARSQEETELSGIAKKSTMPFVRNVQGHEAMEALTLMKFEIDFYPPPRNSKLHVASMKSVFFSIVRSSNGRVSKIPDWYSPPYLAIKEMLPPIGDHFLSTSKRATWADRHQKGAVVPVVLKHTFLEADGIDLFRREVEIWASLNHPNVIKLLGASHCSSPTVLVLEDATRGSISDHVWQCANNQKMLWKLLHDAALGLQYLHSEPYNAVHGNIKPSNLLVSKDGIGKISDFGGGLATLQNRALQYEKFAEKSGEQGEAKYANYGDSVLRWRAPEYQSYKKRPTYQGDVYSFGMCILNAIDRNFIPPIGKIPPGDLENRLAGLSSAARELVVAMTVEDPMKRLTMDQVVEKLSELSESTR